MPGVLIALVLAVWIPGLAAANMPYGEANGSTSTTISIVWGAYYPHYYQPALGGYTTWKYKITYATSPDFSTDFGNYDVTATWFASWNPTTGCQFFQVDPYSSTIYSLRPSTTYYMRIHAYSAKIRELNGCYPFPFDPSTEQLTYTYGVFSYTTTASDPPPPPGGGCMKYCPT